MVHSKGEFIVMINCISIFVCFSYAGRTYYVCLFVLAITYAGRTMFLEAEDEQDLLGWIKALNDASKIVVSK